MFIGLENLPWPVFGHGRFSRPNRRRSPLVDRLRLGEPLREDSSFISYRLPIITAFIVSEVLFETLKGEEKVLKKALR